MTELVGRLKPVNNGWEGSYAYLLKPRPCPYCPLTLEQGKGMAAHIRQEHPEHALDHKCIECEEGFPTKQVLGSHRWNAHRVGGSDRPAPGSYRCDVHSCLQTFDTKSGLGNHRWQAHGIPGMNARSPTTRAIIVRETAAVDALIEILSEFDLPGQQRMLVRLQAMLVGV